MRTIISGVIAVAAGAAVLAAGAARADTITEQFTITVNPAFNFNLPPGADETSATFSPSSSPAQFNPALGALTSVSASLTGAATYTFTGTGENFGQLEAPFRINTVQFGELDSAPGNVTFTQPLNFNLSGSVSDAADLAKFIGTGSATTDLLVDIRPLCDGSCASTFGTTPSGLSGTLTYTFTPAPAPSIGHGLPVLIAASGGLFGAKLLEGRKRRRLIRTTA